MYVCEKCGKALSANNNESMITQTDRMTGTKNHICQECFKEDTGIDYDTYAGRKARSQIGCFGIPLCLIISLFLFWKFGFWTGVVGLGVTFFVYKVATQGD